MSEPGDRESSREIRPGQVVGGKWRIVRLIGRGGMGSVYEAQNVTIGKRAALKFVDAEFACHPEVASRFRREAEAAGLVESAHIVQVFDSGTTESGVPYIVMELLRGEDLRTRLRRFGKLPPEEAVHIIAQTLRGLHRAHEAGIIHRDLKPDNIFLVDRDDDALFTKIVDFGISKVVQASRPPEARGTITREGVVLGTPSYMSPEQAQAMPDVDWRTDLWSAGAILFECLAGRPPFTGHAYESLVVSICTADAPLLTAIDPAIPDDLAKLVARALTRDRAARFQSAKQMLQALQSIAGLGAALTTPLMSSRLEHGGAVATRVANGRLAVKHTRKERPARLLLGAAVMAASFLLTLGILKIRASTRGGHGAAHALPSASFAAPSAPSTPASATGLATTESLTGSGEASAESASPALATASSISTAAQRATDQPRSRKPAASTPRTPTATTTPSGSTDKTPVGIAGDLRIKTNYP